MTQDTSEDPSASDTSDASAETTLPSRGVETSEWEWWVRASMGLAGLTLGLWGLVWMRLGDASLYIHVFGIPTCGLATLPIALWGVMRTVFRPPLLRWRRGLGFGLLLVVGVIGNVPMLAVPLSTHDWQPRHEYRLPFEGEWYTLAGGPEVGRNYHATTAPYRWGYDFAPTRDGKRYKGEGASLEDYYCYGRPVRAPAPGEVVRFEDDRKDMPPGEFDEGSVLGNHVVVRIREGVYLFVAQLAEDSVDVEPGEQIERGEIIGACGNSGRALEPHVHIHLQDRARFPVAQSLPLSFSDYRADGDPVERGMPLGEGEGGNPECQYVAPLDAPKP